MKMPKKLYWKATLFVKGEETPLATGFSSNDQEDALATALGVLAGLEVGEEIGTGDDFDDVDEYEEEYDSRFSHHLYEIQELIEDGTYEVRYEQPQKGEEGV